MSVLTSSANKKCIFCQIISGDSESWKILESDSALAFLDFNPTNAYHTLVVPKEHCKNIFDATEEQLAGVMTLVKRVADLYNEKLGLENIQVINSSGVIAQQDVFHFHVHLIPRYEGDQQDIKWMFRPDLREKFDDQLSRLKL